MQVMPVVWKDISKRYGVDWDYTSGVFEPEKNIEVACAYLAWLRYDFLPRHFEAFEASPETPLALIRDNAPPRATARLIAEARADITCGNRVLLVGSLSDFGNQTGSCARWCIIADKR